MDRIDARLACTDLPQGDDLELRAMRKRLEPERLRLIAEKVGNSAGMTAEGARGHAVCAIFATAVGAALD
jgi:hypothetical protein